MITVEALPARSGDCLWVEWHDGARQRRMLVDGGTVGAGPALTERIRRQPPELRDFELVVCTHFDDDHLGGLVGLLGAPQPGFSTRDVWFNGHRHLLPPDLLGPLRAERLTELLARHDTPWNAAVGGGPLVVPPDGHGPLPVIELPGLTLTLLSPTRDGLTALRRDWDARDARRRKAPAAAASDLLGPERTDEEIPWRRLAGEYSPDRGAGNGSSIAFCAEHTLDGTRVLFTGDAHAEVLAGSLRRLAPDGRFRVDLCKVAHHGSAHNTSPELLSLLDCDQWLISTDGGPRVRGAEARYRPGEGAHPSLRAMSRLALAARWPTLWFNHRVPSTERYDDAFLQQELGFRARYPPRGTQGIALAVGPGSVRRVP